MRRTMCPTPARCRTPTQSRKKGQYASVWADPAGVLVYRTAVWCSITAAWIAYHEKYLGGELLSDEDEKKLLSVLISISTGVEDVEALDVLDEIGRKLMA